MNKCNTPYSTIHASELDVDDLATIPDYFLAIRTLTDGETGNTIYSPVRVPGQRVMPTGNLANVIALATNNTAIEVPENQVLAGYLDVQPGGNMVKLAGESNAAQFLLVGNYTNGKVLIQSTGFLNIPAGHTYIPGTQYYLGGNGEPTTDSSVTGQKLFLPLDDYYLMINAEF